MTFPEWADGVNSDDSPDFVKPNHNAADGERLGASELKFGPPVPPKRGLKERLKNLKNEPQDTRPPRARKEIPNKPGQFIEPVEDVYTMIAMAMMPFKPDVSMAIMSPSKAVDELKEDERVEDIPTVGRACAIAWDNAAQRNESVRRVLDGLTGVGVWGALIGAHMPIIGVLMADSKMSAMFNPATDKEPANV